MELLNTHPVKKSDLGLNPQIDGQLIRLPIPELNEERRTELKKLIKSIGEKCKVSIRNVRREAMEKKKEEEEKLSRRKLLILEPSSNQSQ